jgi:Glycosyl transferases group 1
MKILIIQERGQHDANRDFRESCCLKRSFDHTGHECLIWGKGHEGFPNLPDFDSFDLIVNLENYGDEWMPDLSRTRKPMKMLWCIDAHVRGSTPYEKTFSDGRYHILAHATRDFVRLPHHRWLPNCTDHRMIFPMPDVPKSIRFGFCGNHVTPERKRAVDTLTSIFGLKQHIFVIGNEMVRTINSYEIHFNMNISNDVNYRSFETLACSTVLFTDRNPQYKELGFEDGVNCLMYNRGEYAGDIRFLISDATLAVNMGSKLTTIAEEGRRLFLSRHTYDHRAAEILSWLGGGSR